MISKQEIEHVLGVRITDEQLAHIMQYYREFYSNPESFVNDGLVDLILDDFKVKKPTNIKDILNQADGMEIRHLDPYNSLAWGKYKGVPIYAMFVTGSEVEKVAGYPNVESRPSDQSKDELFAIGFISNDKKSAIVLVMSRPAAIAVTIPEQNAIPGYTGIFTMPLIDYEVKPLHTFYVPFDNGANGRTPVMWVSHNEAEITSSSDILNTLSERWQDWGTITHADDIKKAYQELHATFPSVDREAMGDEARYVGLALKGHTLVYNRNRLAYADDKFTVKTMLPWIVVNILDKIEKDGSHVKEDIYNCLAGVGEWNDFSYYINKRGDAARTESTPITQESRKVIITEGNSRGDGSAKSPIGKMFNNASSDYKQVDVNK